MPQTKGPGSSRPRLGREDAGGVEALVEVDAVVAIDLRVADDSGAGNVIISLIRQPP